MPSKCKELKHQRQAQVDETKKLEQSLTEATLAHDNVVLEKVQNEIELVELNDYVLTTFSKSVNQVVRQVILLYGVPSDQKLDSGKDVYEGQLVAIEDICTTNLDEGNDPPTEGEEQFVVIGLIFLYLPLGGFLINLS